MHPPDVDKRRSEDILEEAKKLASSYVPEWSITKDVASALLSINSNMVEQTINRLNRTLNKSFIEYLNILDVKLSPAQPAKVPVTFNLAKGTTQNVLVPAKTPVQAPGENENPAITFETERTMYATAVLLKAIYSVDPNNDEIYEHLSDLDKGITSELFESSPNQEHALYLGHDNLFNLKKGVGEGHVYIKLDMGQDPDPFISDNVIWEYYGESEHNKEGEWINLVKKREFYILII